ncbi:MAG: hypothetical protein ACRD0D_14410 [Acidimicrobiales bacterium]
MCRPGLRRIGVVWVALAALSGALAACGSDPVAPATSAPPGFTVVSNAKSGFALAVPASWQQIPLTPDLEVFERDTNRLRLKNPKLSSAIELARSINGGEMMAVEPEGTASVNLSIGRATEKTIEEVANGVVAAHNRSGATGVETQSYPVAEGPAVRLTSRFPLATDAGTTPTDETQYLLLRNEKAYFLTVLGADRALADTIAGTLRLR